MDEYDSLPVSPPIGESSVQVQNKATSARNKVQATQGLSRRSLFGATLGLAGLGVVAAACNDTTAQRVQQGTQPIADASKIGHLLRRAGFGASLQDMQTYSTLGFQGAVERLLNYQQVSDNVMEQRLQALKLDLSKPAEQQRWWLLRMAWTQRPLLEKMTLFWHGVLTSSFRKVGGKNGYPRMIVQNNFLREHAFDSYDNILLGITSDPAMLVYLDLTRSRKTHPNENYARELMELFSLGLNNYTQQDVYQAAAALTGWHVSKQDATKSQYVERDHNTLNKTFLGQSGAFDYKDIVRILADNEATPRFICSKLFTFFVHENPSASDIQPLIDTYVKSKHNMGAVMRTLLLSPQFSSPQAYRSRVKSPTEFVVGAYRSLGMQQNGGLEAMTTLMGQTLFNPPNVAGWPGDKLSSVWLNSGTWMARLNYIDLLLAGSRNTRSGAFKALELEKIVQEQRIDTPERFVDHFTSFLLDGAIPADRRMQIIEYIDTKDAKTGSAKTITFANGKSYPLTRVRGALYLLLSSPEYQLN